jgi:hypothetical protein
MDVSLEASWMSFSRETVGTGLTRPYKILYRVESFVESAILILEQLREKPVCSSQERKFAMILERCTQRIIGTVDEAFAVEKEFDALEAKMGNVPPKRRYYATYGSLPLGTFVWEREWESMAALEAYQAITMSDPEWAVMFGKAEKIFADFHSELFYKIEMPA